MQAAVPPVLSQPHASSGADLDGALARTSSNDHVDLIEAVDEFLLKYHVCSVNDALFKKVRCKSTEAEANVRGAGKYPYTLMEFDTSYPA
jgi:sulfur relay (sulfurtransferase) DsrC/TusE family protein